MILCNASNLYFDLAYNKDPEEPGQHWAGFVDARKAWEFMPLNLYLSAKEDLMGRPLDPSSFRSSTQLTEQGRRNILGVQGQLWAENLKSPERMEYLAFPKLLGLAQRAWSQEPWEQVGNRVEREKLQAAAWNQFANTLGQRELPRLDYLHGGVSYRIPLPGALVEEGHLKANVAFPGLKTFDTRNRSSRTSAVGQEEE